LHLENGVWINRTAAGNTLANFCTVGLTSLSPFAIVNGFVPTAAGVTVSGRVTTAEGRGISGARISVTGSTLMEPRVVMTGNRGYYIIEGLTAGETYVVTINSRKFTFNAPSRVYNLVDNVGDADFTANPTP